MNNLTRIRLVWEALLLTMLALMAPLHPARAQLVQTWVHRDTSLSSNAVDRAAQVVVDAGGDVIVTGTTAGGITGTDIVTIKYSGATGTALWQQRYNGPGGLNDEPVALAVDPDGNTLLTGASTINGTGRRHYLAKYSGKTGQLLWEQLNETGGLPKAAVVDSAGNVVVTGYSGGRSLTVKYEGQTGRILWRTIHPVTGFWGSAPASAAVDAEGNILVTTTLTEGDSPSHHVTKLAAANGTSLWSQRAPSGGRAIAVTPDGDIIVGGFSGAAKYRSDGVHLWTQPLRVVALAVDPAGRVVVTGEHGTAKYAADGAVLWKREVVPDSYLDYFRSVTVSGRGHVALTGEFSGRGEQSFVTTQLDSDSGEVIWERRHSGAGRGVVATADGDLVITGSSNDDIVTARLAPEDGALRWETRHDSMVNLYDSAMAVTFDRDGHVIVAGHAGPDCRIAKHARGDGRLLWKQVHREESGSCIGSSV